MRKFDKYVMSTLWFMVLPIVLAFSVLIVVVWEFDFINPSLTEGQIAAILNGMALVAIIYLSGWLINLVWGVIINIKDGFRSRYLDKHPEKCVSREKLAQDFEELAKALREEGEDECH